MYIHTYIFMYTNMHLNIYLIINTILTIFESIYIYICSHKHIYIPLYIQMHSYTCTYITPTSLSTPSSSSPKSTVALGAMSKWVTFSVLSMSLFLEALQNNIYVYVHICLYSYSNISPSAKPFQSHLISSPTFSTPCKCKIYTIYISI